MTEREAIARLKGGDIGGLETLVKIYQVKAVRAAYLITRDWPAAEDIVQMAFLQVYERIQQFDSDRPFGPWFLRSVVNRAITTASRSSRLVALDESDRSDVDVLTAADLADTVAMREIIQSALEKLSPEQRAAIVLHYYLGLSEDEMAHEMICPRGTVKWRLHAARKRLRILLWPLG